MRARVTVIVTVIVTVRVTEVRTGGGMGKRGARVGSDEWGHGQAWCEGRFGRVGAWASVV